MLTQYAGVPPLVGIVGDELFVPLVRPLDFAAESLLDRPWRSSTPYWCERAGGEGPGSARGFSSTPGPRSIASMGGRTTRDGLNHPTGSCVEGRGRKSAREKMGTGRRVEGGKGLWESFRLPYIKDMSLDFC